MSVGRLRVLAVVAAALFSCRSESPPEPTPSASASVPRHGPRGVRFIQPDAEPDFAKLVRARREALAKEGRELVVYVGASWCEPCKRFHEAAARGELDATFPDLTLLEVDLDVDRERLASAGYGSKLVPLFALPAADGRASDRRIEGSVKGDQAVANITPRLRSLLSK